MQQLYPTLINRLQNQHQAIKQILLGVDDSRLIIRPQPNKWNIHDNIAHLVRYQQVSIERIHQLLTKENLFFGRYVAEEDEGFEAVRILPTQELLNKLNDERKTFYELIIHLSDTDLLKTGTHKKFGLLDIIQWIEFFLLHEAHHIYTIFQLANDVILPA